MQTLLIALLVLGYRRYVMITSETLVLMTAAVTGLVNSMMQATVPGPTGLAISLVISAVALAAIAWKKEA